MKKKGLSLGKSVIGTSKAKPVNIKPKMPVTVIPKSNKKVASSAKSVAKSAKASKPKSY